MRSLLFLLLSAPCLAFSAIIPQSGFSGRPGDGTCRDCHPAKTLVPVDSSTIIGLPDVLMPDSTYSCTLAIRYKGLNEWTFEMTTVDSNSVQAGAVSVTDSVNTLNDFFDEILYFKNTIRGAYIGQPDSARWAFDYVAPPAGTGPVSLYWCAYIKNRKQPGYRLLEASLCVPLCEPE